MAKAICERCRENDATSVLYDPVDFAIHGVDPPDEVLHPVCEDYYHLFAHPGQRLPRGAQTDPEQHKPRMTRIVATVHRTSARLGRRRRRRSMCLRSCATFPLTPSTSSNRNWAGPG
jgi:hypothetical protein